MSLGISGRDFQTSATQFKKLDERSTIQGYDLYQEQVKIAERDLKELGWEIEKETDQARRRFMQKWRAEAKIKLDGLIFKFRQIEERLIQHGK